MNNDIEMHGYGTHLRKSRDELLAENERLRSLLREVRLYQFPGYMEWMKRRDQALHRAETCDHKQYDRDKHGRHCPCGAQMWDAGD